MYSFFFFYSRKADPKMTTYNVGFKLVNRLTMHDLKAVQDAFMVQITQWHFSSCLFIHSHFSYHLKRLDLVVLSHGIYLFPYVAGTQAKEKPGSVMGIETIWPPEHFKMQSALIFSSSFT